MLAVSGVLASSSMGWPSIFYFSGVAGLVWSILYFFYGSSSPADSPGRISPEEKYFIESSLNTGDHGSRVHRAFATLIKIILIKNPFFSQSRHHGKRSSHHQQPSHSSSFTAPTTGASGRFSRKFHRTWRASCTSTSRRMRCYQHFRTLWWWSWAWSWVHSPIGWTTKRS